MFWVRSVLKGTASSSTTKLRRLKYTRAPPDSSADLFYFNFSYLFSYLRHQEPSSKKTLRIYSCPKSTIFKTLYILYHFILLHHLQKMQTIIQSRLKQSWSGYNCYNYLDQLLIITIKLLLSP